MTRSEKRNRRAKKSRPVEPIHALPNEIMTHIFHLALDVQPCHCDNALIPQISMKAPDTLSQVCSRWRRIALDLPSLWSHIDLVPLLSRKKFKKLIARGKTFAARAAPLPLHIHIFGRKKLQQHPCNADFDVSAFCASVAARAEALELLVTDWHDYGLLAIESCFRHCVPGTLRTLVTTGGFGKPYNDFNFIEAWPRTHSGSKLLNVSKQRLEDLLLPIKVLRLNDLYFPWASKAYHGLVHLELTCQSSSPKIRISQLQLAQVLAASPGLRYFHFGLGITDSDIGSPAVLNDLELLSFGPLSYPEHNALLQVMSPGSKPLQMSIHLNEEPLSPLPSNEFEEFARHSDIRKLSIKHSGQMTLGWLYELLGLAPSLETLCLIGLDLDHNSSTVKTGAIRTLSGRLDCLKLIDCRVGRDGFREIAETFPVQTVELESCRIYSCTSSSTGSNCRS